MAGYVKIGRSVFGHNMFKEEPYTEREGWIWLICGASYKTDTSNGSKKRRLCGKYSFFSHKV